MLFNGQGIHHRIRLDLHHVLLQLCDLPPSELTPIDVGLSVIVDEDGRINAPNTLDLSHIAEGTCGGLRFSDSTPSVGHAVVEVVPAVAVGAVGGVESTAVLRPGGIRQGEDHAVICPVDQILRGVDVVDVTAVGLNPLLIEGAIQIHTAISPCVSLHVGDKNMAVQYGIVCVFKAHFGILLWRNHHLES